MDLLETVLRNANALEYIEQFRKENIEAKTLKLLVDEDLKIMGIDDDGKREKILKHSSNLQIESEKRVDLKFDKTYVNTAMSQIVQQLVLYNAMMTPMAVRPDIVNVTLPIATACESLSTAMDDLHQEVVKFKLHVLKEKGISPEEDNTKKIIISGIGLAAIILTNFIVMKKFVNFMNH